MPLTYPERKYARGTVPSFAYKVRESMDRYFYARRVLGRPTPGFDINDKVIGRAFAQQHGFAVPAYLSGPSALDQLVLPQDGPFVIKPLYSTSSFGVAFYRPDGQDRFVECTAGTLALDRAGVIAQARAVALQRRIVRDVWVCESLVPPAEPGLARPDDLKLYAFMGQLGLVLHKRVVAGKSRYRWYGPDLKPVSVGKYASAIGDELAPPAWAASLVERAMRMSDAILRPFMRIDFLAAPDDGIFGEFTPHPGSFDQFDARWDAYLGRAWEEAETRLVARLETHTDGSKA